MRKRPSKTKIKYLNIIYQKYSPILKFKKWRRNKLIKKKNSSKKIVLSKFKRRFRITFGIAIIAMLAILAIYYHVSTYLKIKPIPFENQKTQSSFTFPYYNVVFLWFDEENDKYFVDGVVVVSINASDETIKTIGINSDFIINYEPLKQSFTLKTLYNQINTDDSLVKYIKELESFTGLRLDRYVLITKSNAKDLITRNLLDVRTDVEVEVNEKIYSKETKLSLNDTLEYIFEVESGSDRNKIITNITTNFLNSKKGLWDLYFLFWDSPALTSNFYTDMNRDEFFTFFDLLRGKRESKPLLLGDNVGIPASTGLEDGIAKNSIAFEEALREYLQSLSILTEQAQVEIYNATKESGIAGNLSKQISSYGVNVVKVGNFSEERFYTQILLFSEDESVFPNTLSIISKAVKLADFEFEIRDPEESGNFTGDIVIILGQDYVDSL